MATSARSTSCGRRCRWSGRKPLSRRSAHRPNRQLREEAAEAERLAKEAGTPAKSAKVINTLARRWSEFLGVHGEAYGYDEAAGPTIELAVHFQVCLQRFRALGGWFPLPGCLA